MGDKSTDSGVLDTIGQHDILIAVVGDPGVGKSTFINKAAAVDALPTDQALKPDKVQYVVCPKPDLYQDQKVVFLDVPAFDSESNEQVIQNKLRNWLRVVISKRLKISGILYLHRMTEAEFSSASVVHLTSLVTLCTEAGQGPNAVMLVLTTQALPPRPTRSQRKIQNKWNSVFPQGVPQGTRFENSSDSAWEIIKSLTTFSNDLHKQSDPLRSTVSETHPPTSVHIQPAATGSNKSPLKRDFSGIVLEPLPFALAAVRAIDDFSQVQYPEGIAAPNPELNTNAKGGKFRYDRDFLFQFMAICKEEPVTLPPLDAMGIKWIDYPVKGRHQKRTSSSAQATPTQSAPSQGGPSNMPSGRSRNQRGKQRDIEMSFQQATAVHATSPTNLEPVVSPKVTGGRWDKLKVTENRSDRMAIQVDVDSPEFVHRRAISLLSKLTVERFDSVSNQIINLANKSEKEKDGRTLIQVIRLVFERATDGVARSEICARLCRKMMEQISNRVQDDEIRSPEGKPIAGGQLFRKYLLSRCQEDFERGWAAKEATAAAATVKAMEDGSTRAVNGKTREGGGEEAVLHSTEYYAAQKARRRGLGLIRFMGELFKMQMITERIMHECVKKLLGNGNSPEEEEIESLCQLLTTAGSVLDTQKARAHMDVYFQRMKDLTKNPNVGPRIQSMLQDVIELRERGWVVVSEAGANEAPKAQPQRKKLVLLPRTKPIEHTGTQQQQEGRQLPHQQLQRE